jgi:chromosome segregation ATPase
MLGMASAQSIFICTDSRGKKITSDRPIPECLDREQKELNASGTVKRNVGPTLTAQEASAQEARDKKEAEDRARANEERRRTRALLTRYQNQAAHDLERASALTQVDAVIQTANKRMAELAEQRKTLDSEMEFYKNDLSKAPAYLKRRMNEFQENLLAQQRFIANQQLEKKRVNDRFDEELERLKPLWAGVLR